MIRSALILAACASLGACASSGVQLTTTQAMYVAEAGVDGANNAATAAANSGAVKGAAADKLKGWIDTANQATSAAHGAYLAGNNVLANSNLQTALAAIASAKQGSSN